MKTGRDNERNRIVPAASAWVGISGKFAALVGRPTSSFAYVVDGDTLRCGSIGLRPLGIDARFRSVTCTASLE